MDGAAGAIQGGEQVIIKYSDNNENRIEWQHRRGGEWKTAELHELIEAYERATEPGDLISREETIKYFFRPYSNEEAYTNVEIEKILLAMPSAEKTGKWIPVSERLPEMDGWYQCTVSVGKQQRYTMDLYFRCSNKRWIDYRRLSYYQQYELWGYGKSTIKHKISYEELDDIDRTEDVVAWMPFPEPYKEQVNCGTRMVE